MDTIHYPFQTLERLSGDCDDTTVLLASLLGNVGVNTRFVDAPGHIFLLVDTGLHPRNRAALGVDSSMTVVADEQLWLPLETTAVGRVSPKPGAWAPRRSRAGRRAGRSATWT